MAPFPPSKNQPKQQVQVVQAAQFSGPIPPPDILLEYNKVLPNLAERIVTLAEGEAAHRRSPENTELQAGINLAGKQFTEARIGQFLAFGIGVIAIVSGIYGATHGAPFAGGTIGSAGVIGLVSVFILGRHQQPAPPVNQPQSK